MYRHLLHTYVCTHICKFLPEIASIANRPFLTSDTAYLSFFFRSLPKFKGSNAKSPDARPEPICIVRHVCTYLYIFVKTICVQRMSNTVCKKTHYRGVSVAQPIKPFFNCYNNAFLSLLEYSVFGRILAYSICSKPHQLFAVNLINHL